MTGAETTARAHLPPVENQVAVVSSGERGLGLAVVRGLAALGMRTVMGTPVLERGRAALDGLGDLADRVAVRHLDLADPGSVSGLARTVERQLGRCDVLVNNGANLGEVANGAPDPGARTDPRIIETTLLGTWRLTQAITPLMRRHHHGRIVNLATRLGGLDPITADQTDNPWQPAMNTLTRTLSDDLVDGGILVNAYCVGPPGTTDEDPDFATAVATTAWLATLPDDGPTGICCGTWQVIEW